MLLVNNHFTPIMGLCLSIMLRIKVKHYKGFSFCLIYFISHRKKKKVVNIKTLGNVQKYAIQMKLFALVAVALTISKYIHIQFSQKVKIKIEGEKFPKCTSPLRENSGGNHLKFFTTTNILYFKMRLFEDKGDNFESK